MYYAKKLKDYSGNEREKASELMRQIESQDEFD